MSKEQLEINAELEQDPTLHKFEPIGEWWTRCRHCKLAESAHTETTVNHYLGDDTEDDD